MHKLVIYRSTDAGWETIITFKRWNCTLTANVLFSYRVELTRRNSRFNCLNHQLMCLGNNSPCFSHQLQFRFGFANDHYKEPLKVELISAVTTSISCSPFTSRSNPCLL